MSLIADALRKQRLEEAEKRGGRPRIPTARPPVSPPPPRRASSRWVPAVAAIGAIGLGVWLLFGARGEAPFVPEARPPIASDAQPEELFDVPRFGPGPRDDSGVEVAGGDERQDDESQAGDDRVLADVPSTPRDHSARGTSPSSDRRSQRTPEPAPEPAPSGPGAARSGDDAVGSESSGAAIPSPEAGEEPGSTASPRSEAPGLAASSVAQRQLRLTDGSVVTLDFIVWSRSNPFVQIDGVFLEPGDRIGEWTLGEIQRDRVHLVGPDDREAVLRIR